VRPGVQVTMSVRRSAVLAALIAVLFVAGCAGDATSPGAPSAPGETPTSAQPSKPSADQPSAGAETLTGIVQAGVEPGCLLLKSSSGKDHLLLFDEQSVKTQAKVGSSVTVTGTAKPGQLTTCQQGIPFIVTSLRAG
jgi:hypothetical protein